MLAPWKKSYDQLSILKSRDITLLTKAGRPGMLQSTGSQRVRHNWATDLSWTGCAILRVKEKVLKFKQNHSKKRIIVTRRIQSEGASWLEVPPPRDLLTTDILDVDFAESNLTSHSEPLSPKTPRPCMVNCPWLPQADLEIIQVPHRGDHLSHHHRRVSFHRGGPQVPELPSFMRV